MKRHLGNVQFYTTFIALIPRVAPLYPKNFQYANMLFLPFGQSKMFKYTLSVFCKLGNPTLTVMFFLCTKYTENHFPFFQLCNYRKFRKEKATVMI